MPDIFDQVAGGGGDIFDQVAAKGAAPAQATDPVSTISRILQTIPQLARVAADLATRPVRQVSDIAQRSAVQPALDAAGSAARSLSGTSRSLGETLAEPLRSLPGGEWLGAAAQAGGNAAAQIPAAATSPLGVATLGESALPEAAGAAAKGALMGSMVPGASASAQQAAAEPTPQNIMDAAAQTGLAALPAVHGADIKMPHPIDAFDEALDRHNAEADRLVEQDRTQGKGAEIGKRALGGDSLPVEVDGKPWTILQAGADTKGRPIYQVKDDTGKTRFAGYGENTQGYLRTQGAKPVGEPAPEEAAHPDAQPTGPIPQEPPAIRMSARKAAAQPDIPETGVPEEVSRAQDARENLSQQMTGKSFKDLNNPDRLVIDHFVSQGYGFSSSSNQPEAEAKPDIFDEVQKENSNVNQQQPTLGKQPSEQEAKPAPASPAKQAASTQADRPGPIAGERVPEAAQAQVTAPTAREPETKPAYGKTAEVAIPGEETKYPVRYAVREAADVQPSHNPFSFEPNPAYQHQNDSDYSEPANAARVVEHSQNLDPRYVVNDSPTAEQGAPILDQAGNVLGGNNRTMAIKRAYAYSPEKADAYRNEIREKASQFGIDPQQIGRFREPVLVRESTYPMASGAAQLAVTDFNKTATARTTPAEQAVTDGKRMTPSTVKDLAGRIENTGEDSTLAQALRGDNGAHVVNQLVKDGVFTAQEANGFVDERGELTPEAKSRISKGLAGRLFESPAQFQQTPPELRNKLERIAPHVLRTEGREGWGITPQVREAVSALADAQGHGIKNLDDLAKQQTLEGAPKREYSPEAIAIAKTLKQSPNKAAAAFRAYANDEALSREGAQTSMFEPQTRQEAFAGAFGHAEQSPEASLPAQHTPAQTPSKPASKPPSKPIAFSSESGAVRADLLDPLGVGKFVEQDIAPAIREAAAAVVEARDGVLKLVAPTLRDRSADLAGLSLRDRMATYERRYNQATERLRAAHKAFARAVDADNYRFIDNMEHGRPQGDKDLDALAAVFRRMMDQRRAEVIALDPDALKYFYKNYFPHVFENPEKATKWISSFFSKRPFEGSKDFLKHREFPTFKEALDAGMKPVSDNPVDLILLKAREMDKYILAHHALDDLKESGIAGKFKKDDKIPEGFIRIKDPVGSAGWHAAEGAAQVVNNYLTPGLASRSGAYRMALGLNNEMNQAQLGLSAFHATMVGTQAATTKAAVGVEMALRGHPMRGAVEFAKAPLAPFQYLIQGNKLLKAWYRPGSVGAPIAEMANALAKGGGRARMDDLYRTKMVEKMQRAFREGNLVGGVLRSPAAAMEALAKPLMQEIVPRMKMGAFADMARYELERLGPNPSVDQVRKAMSETWDSVENRFGQMTYDNLFMNRMVKDMAQLATRSVGWNLGTVRELGGAVIDTAKLPFAFGDGKPPVNLKRISYVIAMAAITAFTASVYQYLHTGQGPRDIKDLFAPRTGRINTDGTEERVTLPGYAKDVYHYARNTKQTLLNKTSPIVSAVGAMLQNKDFYGDEIRNADDPMVQRMMDVARYAGSQFKPFSVEAFQHADTQNPERAAESFMGIQKAPRELGQSKAEEKAEELMRERMPPGARTREQRTRADAKGRIRQAVLEGGDVRSAVRAERDAGTLSAREIHATAKNARVSPLQRRFKALPIEDALRVFAVGTPEEKKLLRPQLLAKFRRLKDDPARMKANLPKVKEALRQ